ncbi:MAG: hypothetical protein ACFFE4_09365, partial [Candidatus Thorarchaeota archaeon]
FGGEKGRELINKIESSFTPGMADNDFKNKVTSILSTENVSQASSEQIGGAILEHIRVGPAL